MGRAGFFTQAYKYLFMKLGIYTSRRVFARVTLGRKNRNFIRFSVLISD